MFDLETTYKKIARNNQVDITEILEYIEEAAKLINPNIKYNSETTVLALQMGLIQPIIGMATESIEKNPHKVGFQVTKVYDKNRSLIKIITKKYDSNEEISTD
ncbi:hypothetical protein [Intestinibacter sp.]|uniref:hypothetical protein n=1 Tax=Intestinibacter sp. TaxID=1965304 RepID=UPI003F1382FE